MPIAIRRIRAGEWVAYRDLRLRALAEAPLAFGTTLAEARERPDAWWEARVASTAAGDASALFIAEREDAWLGLLGGEMTATATVEVISMWVDPRERRAGLGRLLLDAVIAWARQRGAVEARLYVTDANAPAIALYRSYGFAFTGAAEPHPSLPALRELEMALRLA